MATQIVGDSDTDPLVKNLAPPGKSPQNSSSQRLLFDRFEVHHQLGAGAFGAVFKAFDRRMKRIVALKVFHRRDFQSTRDSTALLREAKAASELRHPNIVGVFEAGANAAGECFLASAFIDGSTLQDHISAKTTSINDAIEIIEKLARATHYAHEKGVIHRDIKPANILIDQGGDPVLADFGVAKRLDSTLQTREGVAVGTPAYMSPEQSRGDQSNITGQSDQWSLGIVLYELLAGERPFQGANLVDQIYSILNHDPPAPLPAGSLLARDLNTVCMKCLAKDRRHRFASCDELADELQRCRSGMPVAARPVGLFEQVWRWSNRNPHIALLLASVNLLLIGLVAAAAAGIFFTNRALHDAVEQKDACRSVRSCGETF